MNTTKSPIRYTNEGIASVEIQLGEYDVKPNPGSFPLHMIRLRNKNTNSPIYLQTDKFVANGPFKSKYCTESSQWSFPIDRDSEGNLFSVITSIERRVNRELIGYLNGEGRPKEFPSLYHLSAERALRATTLIEDFQGVNAQREDWEFEADFKEAETDMQLIRPTYDDKERCFLKPARDLHVYDKKGDLIPLDKVQLGYGEYELLIRAAQIYVGQHGHKRFIASVLWRIVEIRYNPLPKETGIQRDGDKQLMLPPSAGSSVAPQPQRVSLKRCNTAKPYYRPQKESAGLHCFNDSPQFFDESTQMV